MAKSWSRHLAVSALLAACSTQTAAFRVGQDVCVSGYITCLDCNVGAMSPYNTQYNMFQSISHPQSHNLQCLVENESCTSEGYEIVTRYAIESVENKDDGNEVYCRSFQLDTNSSSFIASAGLSSFKTDRAAILVGGYPVSFAGRITDVGETYSSLATVAINTDTLSLSMGGCANENLPHHCISRSGSYQFTANPTTKPTTASPITPSPTKSLIPQLPTKSPLASSLVDSSVADASSSLSTTAAAAADADADTSSFLETTDVFVTTESGEPDFAETNSTALDLETILSPSGAPVATSDSPTAANSTNATMSISSLAFSTADDTVTDERPEILIGDVLQIDQIQEETYMDKEMEIKELFKNHGKLAGASWGILVPLAMSAAWFRESFPVAKQNGATSCGQRLCNQPWLIVHASMAVVAAVATSVSVYFVVKAFSMEGGWEYATKFSSPHQLMGVFLLVGAWIQVLGGIFRPKNRYTGHTKMTDKAVTSGDAGDEENTREENDDSSDSATVSSTSTVKQGAIIHKWRRSANPSCEVSEVCEEDETVMVAPPKSTIRKCWDYGHRFMALVLVICGFWQLFSGLEEYQERYGDDSYLVTACMVWVGVFWSVTFLLTCFFKKF